MKHESVRVKPRPRGARASGRGRGVTKLGALALLLLALFAAAGIAAGPAGAATLGSWSATGGMTDARSIHTATLLGNGKVLVAGGWSGEGEVSSAELYDPTTNGWTPAGNMSAAADDATATLLPDGTVLVAGGVDYDWNALSRAELYHPAVGEEPGYWSTTDSMNTGRYGHTATLLPDGTVLVAGGRDRSGGLSSAEIYDPNSRIWTPAMNMSARRVYATATLLPDGTVLVAGGYADVSGAYGSSSAELYDPGTGQWTATGGMTVARFGGTATLLVDGGGVLVAGGGARWEVNLSSAELYDPAARTWTATGNMTAARQWATATLLGNGKVLVAGGWGAPPFSYLAWSSAELYDPETRQWAATGNMTVARCNHTATLLDDGKVLVAGGYNDDPPCVLSSAELYDPAGVVPPPTLGSFSPSSGTVGSIVTLAGTGLTGATSVTFGGVVAVFRVLSDTELAATVPAGATSGRITVTTPGGSVTSATDFTVVIQPTLTLTLIFPKQGFLTPGKTLTLSGTVTPGALAGGQVTLTVERVRRKVWVTAATLTPTIANDGSYMATFRPPDEGRYQVRATIAATATHTAAATDWQTFTVR